MNREFTLIERRSMLEDAKMQIEDAIENIQNATRDTGIEDSVRRTLIAELEMRVSNETEWLGSRQNTILDLIESVEEWGGDEEDDDSPLSTDKLVKARAFNNRPRPMTDEEFEAATDTGAPEPEDGGEGDLDWLGDVPPTMAGESMVKQVEPVSPVTTVETPKQKFDRLTELLDQADDALDAHHAIQERDEEWRKKANQLWADYRLTQKARDIAAEEYAKTPVANGPATLLYPDDCYPYLVLSVSPSGSFAVVERLQEVSGKTGHKPEGNHNGFPVWSHYYTTDELQSMRYPEGKRETQKAHRRKDGRYYLGGVVMTFAYARYRRDYSD